MNDGLQISVGIRNAASHVAQVSNLPYRRASSLRAVRQARRNCVSPLAAVGPLLSVSSFNLFNLFNSFNFNCLYILLSLFVCAVCLHAAAIQPPLSPQVPAGTPMVFEAFPGKSNSSSAFLVKGHNYQFIIQPTQTRLVLCKPQASSPAAPTSRYDFVAPRNVLTRIVGMQFRGASAETDISGAGELPGKINYLVGNEPAKWRTGISAYSQVRVDNLYPGVSVLYYGNQKSLEYDFTIAPGASPEIIQMQFEGADKLSINENGELVIKLEQDEVRQHRPEIYQMVKGVRRVVPGGYHLVDGRTAGFTVSSYDKTLPLIIDPVLSYAGYFGGNNADIALSVKLGADGSIFMAGETLSTTNFPFASPPPGYTNVFQGGQINGDGFVAKFDNSGASLIYFTYIGGSENDGILDLAVNPATGEAFVTGFTESADFPTANALYPHIAGARDPVLHVFPTDAFISRLNTNGNGFIYSTYFGGNSTEVAGGIAIDPSDNAYITGYTYSMNLPVTNTVHAPFQSQLKGSNDVFVAKISADGQSLMYSTYFGGTNLDQGEGIAADGAGIAYVTGYTCSTNFFTSTNPVAFQPIINRSTNAAKEFKGKAVPRDAFLLEFDTMASGSNSLRYSTFLGGTNNDSGNRIRLDSSGSVYIVGNSASPDFTNTHSSNIAVGNSGTNVVNFDAFLTKFAHTSSVPSLVYSILFGGKFNDAGWDVTVDSSQNAYVVGITASPNFPTNSTSGFLRSTNSGDDDVFVTAFAANPPFVLYSAYIGGSSNDFGYGIAVDSLSKVYIVGQTLSTNFPVTNNLPAFAHRTGTNDAFLAIISPPDATSPPISATVSPTPQNNPWGSNTTFTVSVSGGAPTIYQWKKDGVNLTNSTHVTGATSSSITISNITAADAGSYTVGVSNNLGGVISSPGVLTVFTPPPLISSIMISGGNVVMSFTSTNDFDTSSSFILQSAGNVTGPYTNNPSGSFSGSGGSFQVVAPRGGDRMFYRLRHVD